VKLCIVSDSHDRGDLLAAAVRAAAAKGAEAVIHCGDVIGTQTLRASLAAGLPTHVIHGNNLGDPVSLSRWARDSNGQLHYHGADARLSLGGQRIFVVHYPEYGHAMACTGDWDLVCCGHSHSAGVSQVDHVRGGKPLRVLASEVIKLRIASPSAEPSCLRQSGKVGSPQSIQ
jgi:predicted phosphodiesterase